MLQRQIVEALQSSDEFYAHALVFEYPLSSLTLIVHLLIVDSGSIFTMESSVSGTMATESAYWIMLSDSALLDEDEVDGAVHFTTNLYLAVFLVPEVLLTW
jgi:hypothetical protein